MKRSRARFVAILFTVLGICGHVTADEVSSYYAGADSMMASACPSNCCGPTADCGCQWGCAFACACDPLWCVRANALWMRLSRPNNAVLVTDSFEPGGTELLNASEFHFNYEGGWEIALERRLDNQWEIEGRFFRVDGFSASRGTVLSAAGSVVEYVHPIGNPDLPATIGGSYGSELTSVELNAHREINDVWSLVLGFRYLSLNEAGLTVVQDIGPGLSLVTHDIRATNDLYGFQLGTDANLWSRNRLSVEGLLRAGIYGNSATNGVTVEQLGQPLVCRGVGSHTAFAGELGIAAQYQFSEHLFLRAGYQLLWLEGVAQASDQVAVSDPANDTAQMSFKSSPFYDGAFIGLEFTR